MALFHNDVYDDGLNSIDVNAENLYILNGDPGLTWGNIATMAVGVKAAPEIAAPSDRAGGGREVIIAQITDGTVSASDTITHYAITDDSESKILVSGTLAASRPVVSGDSFLLPAFPIGIPTA